MRADARTIWFSDLFVRRGITVNDTLLIYGTVGLAAAMVDFEVTAEGDFDAVANDSQLHFGPSIGVGASTSSTISSR